MGFYTTPVTLNTISPTATFQMMVDPLGCRINFFFLHFALEAYMNEIRKKYVESME